MAAAAVYNVGRTEESVTRDTRYTTWSGFAYAGRRQKSRSSIGLHVGSYRLFAKQTALALEFIHSKTLLLPYSRTEIHATNIVGCPQRFKCFKKLTVNTVSVIQTSQLMLYRGKNCCLFSDPHKTHNLNYI